MITQRWIEARQLGQLLEHLQQLIRQPLQHFAFDIFGEQLIMLTRLQRAGGKRLPAADFLRGFDLQPGMVLGAPAA